MDTTLPHLRVVVVYRRPRPPEFSTGSANSNGSSKPEEKEWTPEEDATLLQLFMSNPLGPDWDVIAKKLRRNASDCCDRSSHLLRQCMLSAEREKIKRSSLVTSTPGSNSGSAPTTTLSESASAKPKEDDKDFQKLVFECNFNWDQIGRRTGMKPYEARDAFQRQCPDVVSSAIGDEEEEPPTHSMLLAFPSTPLGKLRRPVAEIDESDSSLSMSDLEEAFLDQIGSNSNSESESS